MQPFATVLDWQQGTITPHDNIVVRRLGDMKAMYHDQAAVARLLEAGDHSFTRCTKFTCHQRPVI